MATSSQMTDMMKDLTCVICLQLYEEPVTLPCGHSFCCCCIKKSWESREGAVATAADGKCLESREGATGFACPNCRKVFLQKPPLNKNVILASVVKQMKPSGSEEIGCTHKEKVHKLVKLGEKDERPRCTKHGNLLDFYCKDDESLMCLMCMVGHQDHQVVAAEVAHAEFKGILVAKYPPLVESTQQVKSRMQQVQQEVEDAQVSGRGSVEKLEQKQRAIYRAVDENVKQIKRCLNGRLEVKLSHLEYQRENLQKEMDSLDDAESNLKASLEKLEATSFLLGYKDILHKLESKPHFTSKHSQQPRLLDFHVQEQNVKSLIQLDENLIKGIQNELVKELKISDLGTNILKRLYGRSLSLDQNSAHSQIVQISEDLKTATLITTKHLNLKNLLFPLIAAQHLAILGRTQHRGSKRTEVLSNESFSSGRHYWEVDVRSCRFWRIGLALNSIVWKGEGNERRLGVNNESWCVEKCFHQYTAIHNKQRTHLPVPRNPKRLGFLLDCEKGELRCFGDTRILHIFRSNFTDSVKPVLQFFGSDSGSVHMCSL